MKNYLTILVCLLPAVSFAEALFPSVPTVQVSEFIVSLREPSGQGTITQNFVVSVEDNTFLIQSLEVDSSGGTFRGGVSRSPIVCGSNNAVVREAVSQLPSRGFETGCGPNGSLPNNSQTDRNRVGFGQSNPALADDFFTGVASCKLFQFEGVNNRGEACLANVRFGRTTLSGGEGGGECIPGTAAAGTLTILNSTRRVVATSTFGDANFSYNARSRDLSLNSGLECNIRGFYTFPADGNVKPF